VKKSIEIASGIVMIVAALFSFYIAFAGRIGSCFVSGGSWLNYIIVYLITAVFAVLGVLYIIHALK
jgi:hypothetical protein